MKGEAETFEELQTADVNPALQQAIEEAEEGIAQGRWVEHAEVEAKLQRWIFDPMAAIEVG